MPPSGKPQADLARTLRLETMIDIREVCDAAEGLCPADLWTLPTYTDLLFLDQTTNVDKNASHRAHRAPAHAVRQAPPPLSPPGPRRARPNGSCT